MSSFVQYIQAARSAAPDASKHVNYNMGMVLGVDDFTQEFAYLAGHDEWALRDLIGYGTAAGLRVYLDLASAAPMLVVTKGTAVSPRGQLIKVEPDQCVDLNKWLLKYKEKVDASVGAQPINATPPLGLYLVLCYRECPTDLVPIPGEPCRSDDETRAPSRLKDDFKLELRFRPPNQYEEDAVRDFVTWLGDVEITEDPLGTYPTVGQFIEEIRRAARDLPVPVTSPPLSPPLSPLASPPESPPASPPDYMYGSPPAPWRIHVSQACEYLRAAFRVWVTELRPLWQKAIPAGVGCEDYSDRPDNPDDGALLLAELTIPLVRSSLAGAPLEWQVADPAAVAISEERRPYLVHLRMLQEWLMCGPAPLISAGGSTVTSPPVGMEPHDHAAMGDVIGQLGSNTVVRIGGKTVDLSEPLQEGQVLTYEQAADHWKPKPVPPPGPQPIPPLVGDAVGDVGSNTVVGIGGKAVDLSEPLQEGQVLTYEQAEDHWKPKPIPTSAPQPIPPLGGDLSGAVPDATVIRIRNVPVAAAHPLSDVGKFLRFVGGQWRPDTVPVPPPPVPGGDLSGTVASANVIRIQNVPVAGANPAADEGKVLRLVGGQWRPDTVATPPPPVPGGDLSGTVANATVIRIQNLPVAPANPAADNFKVLRLEGGQWKPATLNIPTDDDFVQHPRGVGPFGIVAAGTMAVRMNSPRGYNDLQVVGVEEVGGANNIIAAVRLSLNFNRYRPPGAEFQYIVKALPVFLPALELPAFVASFVRFLTPTAPDPQGNQRGFILLLTPIGRGFPKDQIPKMEVMVEVSMFPFKE